MLHPLPELWGSEHCDLVDRLVPDSGPANTVQGEVLRAAMRVKAEFYRNGCGNWPADPEFFDGFVEFLIAHLCDGTFDAETEVLVKNLLTRLRAYGHCDYPLRSEDEKWSLDKELDKVEQIAVAWCLRHDELIPWGSPDARGYE